MASYTPGRGPNISQFLADLNSIPSPQDGVAQPQDSLSFEDDLALFTNANFDEVIDFGEFGEQAAADFQPSPADVPSKDAAVKDSRADMKHLNFSDANYQFSNMAYVPAAGPQPASPAVQTFHVGGQRPPFDVPFDPSTATTYIPQVAGSKRPFSPEGPSVTSVSSPTSTAADHSSRAAAEEDKRRRNTAASARFRVKKKQREQALEKTAKEMSDRAEELEARIEKLEQENQLLRSLVVAKAASVQAAETEKESKVSASAGAKVDVDSLLKDAAEDKRSPDTVKKGVGTADKAE